MTALDLFCCGGGATKGLQRLGFHVTGVDIAKQPHYLRGCFYSGGRPQHRRKRLRFHLGFATLSTVLAPSPFTHVQES